MDTKWKSTDNALSLPEGKPAPPAKGKRPGRLRAVCGFLAFVLGVSLLVESGLFFAGNLTSAGSRQWLADSFQADWRDTAQFRGCISGQLDTLIRMGTDSLIFNWGRYSRLTPKSLHSIWKEDENLLYRVEKEGEELYRSSTFPSDASPQALLGQGYGFLLEFDGEKVRIWQDGKELTVYGSDYYDYDREGSQWYVPGYKNLTVSEAGSRVRVTMAVLTNPRLFLKSIFDASTVEQYNELYYLKQNLDAFRLEVLVHLSRLGIGAGLLLLYVLLRKGKAQADRFLARGTGKLWFEVKLALALALLWLLLPLGEGFAQVLDELVTSYSYGVRYGTAVTSDPVFSFDSAEQEAVLGPLGELGMVYIPVEETGTENTAVLRVLGDNAGWLLRAWAEDIISRPAALLAALWGVYLLLINDMRYNKKPWRHGVIALLCAWGLKLPVQKRLSRVSGLTALALLLLGGANVGLLIYACSYGWGRVRLENVWLICAPALGALAAAGIFLRRQRLLWEDLGAVCAQARAVRAGDLERTLELPPDHDLHELADDLSHIQQGLHQAVEERVRSEQMKVELVTNVSHDLKTPLTSIISYTELLEQEHLEPPAGEYVAILGEKARRLKTMVQDVFEVSKAASGQLPVKLERLDFARLLRQTLADMDAAITDSGLAFRVSLPEGEVPILADSDRMYRVFQNLLGNALKYSLAGSRVYVELTAEGKLACATVRNTSACELKPGVDYTGRFVRGDESRTDGGSGLGLSIAESFTRACGGELEVSTQADLFTVRVSFPVLAG